MRTLTEILLVVVVVFLLIYDGLAVLLIGFDATISVVVLEWSQRYPVIPFLCGVVAGHFWWPQRKNNEA